jgi:hypothetical protein
MFTCPSCKKELKDGDRGHICEAARSIHGRKIDAYVAYVSRYTTGGRQSKQPGYMKRFGSRPIKHRAV